MDVELDNLIKLIFPGDTNVPDNWKENPDIADYISKLGSHGLENISKEPDRLKEAQASILQQTQDVAFDNYKIFIQTAECSREIFLHFNETEEKLDSLIDKLPEFQKTCQNFIETSNDINTHRRLNSLTLTRNAQLLEILELPQLMDTCIRNGNYEEALELAGYVRRLGKKHGQIPLIEVIVREVELSWLSMLHTLLAQLRTDLQLPKCLQVVGYLRRMELFSEAEIRLKFLQARDSWLQSLLAAIPKEDANQHLSKTIELSRIHLFNIVTQYRAIFTDEDPVIPSSKYQDVNECTIFYSWITAKVSQFLCTLETDLECGIGNSLDSVLGQCMYFGLSFSRVGADFRGLLAPIFVRTVASSLEHNVRQATRKYEQDMEQFSFRKTLSNFVRGSPTGDQSDKPPACLLEFYPLAEYCNGVVAALNELRLCAPMAAAGLATRCLDESLHGVTRHALVFYRQELQALTKGEKDSMNRFCAAIADGLVPHVQKCLHSIYPPAAVARHLGVTVQQMVAEHLTYLNKSSILDAIAHLLPVRLEPILPSPAIPSSLPAEPVPAPVPAAIEQRYPELGDDDISATTGLPPARGDVADLLNADVPAADTRDLGNEAASSEAVNSDLRARPSGSVSHSLLDVENADVAPRGDGEDKLVHHASAVEDTAAGIDGRLQAASGGGAPPGGPTQDERPII